jgi:putative FmdB family regulatory protein
MPSYDLRCTECDTTFEVFRHGFLRDEDRTCGSCGSTRVDQLFTGFVLARSAASSGPEPGGGGGCCGGACGCGAG